MTPNTSYVYISYFTHETFFHAQEFLTKHIIYHIAHYYKPCFRRSINLLKLKEDPIYNFMCNIIRSIYVFCMYVYFFKCFLYYTTYKIIKRILSQILSRRLQIIRGFKLITYSCL